MASAKVENSRFKFDTKKPSKEIIRHAKALGFESDMQEFSEGGDWIWLRRMYPKGAAMPLQVKFNTVNGLFFAWTPFNDDKPASERSVELEGTDWYDELLMIMYRPEVNRGDRAVIKAQGRVVAGLVVEAVLYADGGWYIEMTGANVPGGYSYWKQRDDGGFLIGLTPAAFLTSEVEKES